MKVYTSAVEEWAIKYFILYLSELCKCKNAKTECSVCTNTEKWNISPLFEGNMAKPSENIGLKT